MRYENIFFLEVLMLESGYQMKKTFFFLKRCNDISFSDGQFIFVTFRVLISSGSGKMCSCTASVWNKAGI